MNEEKVLDLLARYEAGTCNDVEKALLEKWFFNRLHHSAWKWESETERQLVKRAMQLQLETQLFSKKRSRIFTVKRVLIAASLLVCCAVSVQLYLIHRPTVPVEQFYVSQAVAPGSNAARLTLADGKTIWLDDAQTGTVYRQKGISVTKQADGGIHYKVDNLPNKATAAQRNTISVPRGGQYRLVLPDGTKVWLNSATTLTYPLAFADHERTVSVTGEAYFEVAKNETKPFKVNANNTEIAVTGTQFNITAYAGDAQVTTTLLEGGVRVTHGSQQATLAPGQQAISTRGADILTKYVDTDYSIAWVKGDFLFEDQDIRAIMKDISRWYNVDVVFEGTVPAKKFGGTYTRSKGLKELLRHLESLSDIRFTFVEGRVHVMK